MEYTPYLIINLAFLEDMFKTKSLKLYKSIGLQLMAKEIADV